MDGVKRGLAEWWHRLSPGLGRIRWEGGVRDLDWGSDGCARVDVDSD